MTNRWSIAKAKEQLSAVVARAKESAQVIENRGQAVAVIVDVETYGRLVRCADEAQPAARIRGFVKLSREIAAQGGAEIELPKREARPSPFAKRKR